ncbi:MAG: nucleotidyltransferase domain-containing protein [Alphaproteobacteria bacterium]|nr:nucleotidyltransferase domain-containing protein [Alphaproteobacteria bacterium]
MPALLDTVLQTIRERRDAIEARYGVRLVGVVGSVARGDERPDSDIDLIYEVTGRPSLFDLARVMGELEDALGRPIDLVDPSGMRPSGWQFMSKDLVTA